MLFCLPPLALCCHVRHARSFAMFLPHLTRNGLYQQPVTPTPAPATPEPQQLDAQPRQPPPSEGADAAGVPEAAARGPGAQPAVPDRDASTTVQPAAVGAAGAGAGVAAGVRLGAGVPLQLQQQAGQPRDRLGAALGRRLARILLRGETPAVRVGRPCCAILCAVYYPAACKRTL